MNFDKELIRLAVFAGLIARSSELDEDRYIYLWKKADHIAKRIRAFEKQHRALMRALKQMKREAEARKEGEA